MSSEITKSPYKSLYFQYSEKRKDCEELISLFDALYDLEISHSHSLEKIADQIRESKNSSCLKEILDAFCKYMTNKAHQSQQLSENLVSDIISPLKNTAKSYNSIMKKISLECNRLLKKKQKLIDETSTAKNKYWKICGSCESDLLSLDLSIDQNKIIVNRSKKDVEKYLKIYLDLVENCNRVISSFNESSKKFREDYQTESQILLENFKDSFRKFVVYDTSCVRNIQYDLETFSQMVQSCELEVLRKIVIDSAKELIYEPFQSNHPFFKSLSSNDVQFPASLEGLSKIGTLYKRDLDKILNKAYQGIKLNSSDYQQFNCIIKETMGRKCWCLCLNSYKNKGSVQLPDQGFLQISELSLSFLNECEREEDLSALKDCVFLSSVFFKENPFKKQLLRDAISSHSIFENIDV